MKKISRKDYEGLSAEHKEIVIKLGLQVEDDFSPSRTRRVTDSLLENYAALVQTECKLCHTVTTRVFHMEGVGGLLTSTESTLEKVEGLKVKTRAETTFTCSCCHDVLKLMAQEDLISLTIKAAKGDTRCRRKE